MTEKNKNHYKIIKEENPSLTLENLYNWHEELRHQVDDIDDRVDKCTDEFMNVGKDHAKRLSYLESRIVQIDRELNDVLGASKRVLDAKDKVLGGLDKFQFLYRHEAERIIYESIICDLYDHAVHLFDELKELDLLKQPRINELVNGLGKVFSFWGRKLDEKNKNE